MLSRSTFVAIALIATLGIAVLARVAPTSAQDSGLKPQPVRPERTEIATFAGGCFWCVEADFDKIDGVVSTVSGYMGGTTANPTYRTVSAGGTGHLEVVQVTFDPTKVTYRQLVDRFWRTIDPFDRDGQFCDRGESYMTAIFTSSPEQKADADASLSALAANSPVKKPVATTIRAAGPFTAAEDEHQDYYMKNPARYKFYRYGCGRDHRLTQLWGDKAGH